MKKTLVAIVCALGLVLIVTNARAAITLSYGDACYVGLIVDGVPSNPSDEKGYINILITLGKGDGNTTIGSETYNRKDSTLNNPLPPVIADLGKDEIGPPFSWTVNTNDPIYILGKYDAANAGSLVWLVKNSSGVEFDLPATFSGQGLSHISAYSSVPIPGAIYLLGSGLVGLVGIGRWRRRK